MRRLRRIEILAIAAFSLPATEPIWGDEDRTPITHGVMIGDVGPDRAVIWSRSDRESTMHVWVQNPDGREPVHAQTRVLTAHDFTGKLLIQGLRPDTEYQFAVRFGGDSSLPRHDPVSGTFRTAPIARNRRAMRLVWGSEVSGHNTCRDQQQGFPIFSVLARLKADFFVALGNMISTDEACEQRGRYGNQQIPLSTPTAQTIEGYWDRWKYLHLDRNLQELLSRLPYFPVWNDHEIANDAGPLHDSRVAKPGATENHLLPISLAAFLDYNPVQTSSQRPLSIYRTVRWGQSAELFLLDTRQYRDSNFADDKAERAKTMLGREQLTWLKYRLTNSDATWKIIASSVPLSVIDGGTKEKARDGWANGDQNTGFERELEALLSFLRGEGIKNTIWLTGDGHAAQAIRYQPFGKGSAFIMYEFTAGPLNAALLPNRILDQTFRPERMFFYGPENAAAVQRFEDAKSWMNAGLLEVDEAGTLVVKFITATGRTAWTSAPLTPR